MTQELGGDLSDFEISTHTLTWSVTYFDCTKGVEMSISTHTLTWSVTCSINAMSTMILFQLTRSRGA